MFKSLLLRALSVDVNDEPEDVRFANAFKPLCELSGQAVEPNQAFTVAWLAHAREQKPLAAEASRRFLDRYEIKSLWEIQEIQEQLNGMWELAQIGDNSSGVDDEDANQGCRSSPSTNDHKLRSCAVEEHEDPDAGKPRVTVRQYAALIGQEVMAKLEALARARREKHPRAYQTDVEIHQSYISATSGGADGPIDGPERRADCERGAKCFSGSIPPCAVGLQSGRDAKHS